MAPWVDKTDLCPGGTCAEGFPDDDEIAAACWLASVVLYEFSGQRWPGPAEELLRPCGYRTADACGCGLMSWDCCCGGYRTVVLPSTPVIEVIEVKIAGEIIDPDRYLLAGNELIYQPETETAARQDWPCCQRLDRADTEPDTWSIRYSWGANPPADAVLPAKILATELAKSRGPKVGSCRLPQRITNITRQGVSMAILDPLTLFKGGQTGIPEVDLWLGAMAFGANRRPARVFAVDRMPRSKTGY